MASVPAARSQPDRAIPLDLNGLLPWCAWLLLVLYGLGVVSTLIPVQLSTPQWQLRLCEALINQSPLLLMGLSVAVIARHLHPTSRAVGRLLGWTRRAALPLTLGFALLIPLQGMASLQLLQTLNRNSSALISSTNRNLAAAQDQIARAGSSAELEALLSQLPLRLPPLTQLGTNLASQQLQLQQVLDQVRGRTLLQVQVNRQQQQSQVLGNSVRLSLLAALLACLFQQVHPGRPPLIRWRWTWRAGRRPQRTLPTDMARYCEGTSSSSNG